MSLRTSVPVILLTLLSCLASARAGDDSDSQGADLPVGTVQKVDISKLHPTQFRVGKLEVKSKSRNFEKMSAHELKDYQKSHPCPVVIGPDGTYYVVDEQHRADASFVAEHQHDLRALADHGHPTAYMVVKDSYPAYRRKTLAAHGKPLPFDQWMTKNHYVNLDDEGKARAFSDLPAEVTDLKNDAYRSLAGFLEKKAYSLDKGVYFAQFKVADWLRSKLKLSDDEVDDLMKNHPRKFMKRVSHLLESPAAKEQPWFKGPTYTDKCVSCLVDRLRKMAD